MQNFVHGIDVLSAGIKAGITGLMNLAGQAADPSNGVYFVNFNQDFTSLAVGSKTGYKLFTLSAVDNLVKIYENESEDICLVERLFNSSLVAVVSLSSPRKLKVCHFKKGTEICNYSYSNTILAIKLNRKRLVVCLEDSLYVHNIQDMRVLHNIRDTPANPMGLCTLCNGESSYLAYPGSSTIGEVQVFDALNLSAKIMIPAHESPLAAMAFNYTGQQLATASERGTVIRVFNVADGSRLWEFRRGVKRCVAISSLAFSPDAMFLCCSSNTETVHVFRLDQPDSPGQSQQNLPQPAETGAGWMEYLSMAVSKSANLLPARMTDVFSQGRAFATAHLPFQGVRSVCCVVSIQKVPRLLVASADGYLYVYEINTAEGGDCVLLRQHKLDGKETEGCPPKAPSGDVVDKPSSSLAMPKPEAGAISSYAGILKGSGSADVMSDSDKLREMKFATELPPEGPLQLDDDSEFPPVTQKTE
ncbi:Hypothetical predicted protein [Cloeon dipterum]|uniref:WD repeat domain phosphoinositide-interacting protein 2 n=1 Tax=Cloeon dipterum TaxID=197152 RepID=A0A8S1CZ24_9INSE|nr:Hypothetical predicted protein [Cloeon dipterum]